MIEVFLVRYIRSYSNDEKAFIVMILREKH